MIRNPDISLGGEKKARVLTSKWIADWGRVIKSIPASYIRLLKSGNPRKWSLMFFEKQFLLLVTARLAVLERQKAQSQRIMHTKLVYQTVPPSRDPALTKPST